MGVSAPGSRGLANGKQAAEPLELIQLDGRWWAEVPEFQYFAAAVIHRDP